jgi:tetrahydromethanopterin S-methyltransferase subunit D
LASPGKDQDVHSNVDPTSGLKSELAVTSAKVGTDHRGLPIEIRNSGEIHAVLGQIAGALRLVPFELHIGTSRM